ncbi:hypothetical protein M0805_000329 [Coniferiporia weirii]|nr:hypothetical protein M0805_000329 [Coniferiporia weirii]
MAGTDPPSPILIIPAELTEHALVLSHPRDVASFAQTCRIARALVYDARDQHLWRRLFLEQPFDDPRNLTAAETAPTDSTGLIDWKKELQHRVYTTRIIQKIKTHPPELSGALDALINIVKNAHPMPEEPNESKDLRWLAGLISEHDVFGSSASEAPEWTIEEQQRLLELWSYIGWRVNASNDAGATTELLSASRSIARAFVYDMRNYSRDNSWGPFMPDKSGHVNWKHVESIITVIRCNLLDLRRLWLDTRPPSSLNATRAYSAPGSYERDPRDWAGVEGSWRRYVCFMDYRDLFSMFRHPSQFSSGAYNPDFFDDTEFQEATRLIELTLRITKVARVVSPPPSSTPSPICSSTTSPTLPSSAFVSASTSLVPEQRPKIYFVGTSRGGNGNEAKVRGSVSMTPDGYIRWRFASIYDGHSQWSSEGIQIGNVCSAAGVVGTWTGAHHEEGWSSLHLFLISFNDYPRARLFIMGFDR